jgi:uncharacterized membrane protein (UPF0127 family)
MMRRGVAIALLVLIAASGIAPAHAQPEAEPPWRKPFPEARATAEIVVGDTPLLVELALEPDQQSLGLGYRNGLEPGTGMLFVFPDAAPRTFWMKGMRFCLDIIWIEDGEIVGAAESVCPDPEGTADAERERFSSGEPVTYVLEVPAGWLDENGYGEGTDVQIPDELGLALPTSSIT